MTAKSEKKDKKPEKSDGLEELQKKLDEAEAKAGEYLQMAQRLQADFDNFRKRTQRENEEFKAFATAGLISELLTIEDDLDRALDSAKEENDFVIGVRGIRQNLMKILESKGLTEIPTDGKFDPNCHEALCVEESDTDGDIAEVFQKGYRLGNKVLRYSKVKVTRKRSETQEGE
jgi:molecular chaperone GrpE